MEPAGEGTRNAARAAQLHGSGTSRGCSRCQLWPPTRATQTVLGVPLALTDYGRTLDWIEETAARGARRLLHRGGNAQRDGLPGGPELRKAVLASNLTVPRPAARVGDQPARARPAE